MWGELVFVYVFFCPVFGVRLLYPTRDGDFNEGVLHGHQTHNNGHPYPCVGQYRGVYVTPSRYVLVGHTTILVFSIGICHCHSTSRVRIFPWVKVTTMGRIQRFHTVIRIKVFRFRRVPSFGVVIRANLKAWISGQPSFVVVSRFAKVNVCAIWVVAVATGRVNGLHVKAGDAVFPCFYFSLRRYSQWGRHVLSRLCVLLSVYAMQVNSYSAYHRRIFHFASTGSTIDFYRLSAKIGTRYLTYIFDYREGRFPPHLGWCLGRVDRVVFALNVFVICLLREVGRYAYFRRVHPYVSFVSDRLVQHAILLFRGKGRVSFYVSRGSSMSREVIRGYHRSDHNTIVVPTHAGRAFSHFPTRG